MSSQTTYNETDLSQYRSLYRIGGVAAIVIAILIPFQAIAFIVSPPPNTVIDYFTLFQRDRLLGLLDLDFLMIVDNILLIPLFLALYIALRRTDASWILIGTTMGLMALAAYFASREATITMIALSDGYAAATTDSARTAFLGAGQAVLASYNGTAFHLSYNIGQAAGVIIGIVMLRSKLFGRVAPWACILGNLVGWGLYVPDIGIYISLFSVLGLWVWMIGTAHGLFKLSPRAAGENATAQARPQTI